ncbi:hypothetical protein HDU97_005445 [Phlyctochytrium planicorne]|nr:hypothetical protein HDU97_005445 [Phlyctochytrium planicorne]
MPPGSGLLNALDLLHLKDFGINQFASNASLVQLSLPTFQGFTPSCTNRTAWTPLQNTPLATTTISAALTILQTTFPPFNSTLYLQYFQTGNRGPGETMLKTRYEALHNIILAECIEWQGRFLSTINAALISIATQPSWVLPAHDLKAEIFLGINNIIDLGSATLSAQLTQYYLMLQPVLNTETKADITTSLTTRTITPMLQIMTNKKTPFWWLSSASNWNAVCLAGTTYTLLALIQDEPTRTLALNYILTTSTAYLASFDCDGFGAEGIGYFYYGFGYYSYLREIILSYTLGQTDIFAQTNIPNIALYPFRLAMRPNLYAPLGDSIGDTIPSQLLQYIRWSFNLTSTLPTLPPHTEPNLRLLYLFPSQFSARRPVSDLSRQADGKENGKINLRSVFNNASTVVLRDSPGVFGSDGVSRMEVTFKNGGNGGHSHNDIGSYVVALDGIILTGDPGGPLIYNSSTFSSDRYNSPLMNSIGHPLPLFYNPLPIPQLESTSLLSSLPSHRFNFTTLFTPLNDTITVDLTKAYFPASAPKKLITRKLSYTRGKSSKVLITDTTTPTPALYSSWETCIISTGTVTLDNLTVTSTWTPAPAVVAGRLAIKTTMLKFTISTASGDYVPFPPTPDASITLQLKEDKYFEYGKSFTRIAIKASPSTSQPKLSIMVTYEPA